MTYTTTRVFDAQAPTYDGERRRLIPCFDDFYGSAVAALSLAGRPLHRVLDLGAGTGLLAEMVLDRWAPEEMTLLDGAPAMLEQARARLGDRARFVVGDLADDLPPGPWDAVVSALAVHHLDDAAKRALFARIHAGLAPGGLFVNAEQVAGPSAIFHDAYGAWHARASAALGATEAEWAASQERMRLDLWASAEHQMAWLREAGFADVDCLFKQHCFAVLVARRAG